MPHAHTILLVDDYPDALDVWGLYLGRAVAGNRIAVYRDAQGRFSLLSPICPHLGCHVAWNSAESTWDRA